MSKDNFFEVERKWKITWNGKTSVQFSINSQIYTYHPVITNYKGQVWKLHLHTAPLRFATVGKIANYPQKTSVQGLLKM